MDPVAIIYTGIVIALVGAVTAVVTFASTDYNTGHGPGWAGVAGPVGAIVFVTGVATVVAGLVWYGTGLL